MMKKLVTGQEEEPVPRDDQGVAEELESLYCRVARLDQEDFSGGESGDPLPGEAHAPIRPAASPGNHCRPRLCQGELEVRLDRIAATYEEILSLWPSASKEPPPPFSGESYAETLDGEVQREGISGTVAGYSLFRRYPWAVGTVAATVVIVFLLLVWPTPKPITPPSPAVSYSDQGGMPPPVSSKAPSNAVKIPLGRQRGYSVQIKALRNEHEARSFAEAVKKTEPEIHIETVLLEGSGVWHRVLIGDFKTENEALEYYATKRAKELFPGSFIREPQR